MSSKKETEMSGMERGAASASLLEQEEISSRRHLEEKLSFLSEFNRLLIESSGDCILVVDAEGRVVSINKTGRELLNACGGEQGTGCHWATLFPGLDSRVPVSWPAGLRARETFHASSKGAGGDARYWSITFTSFGGEGCDRYLVVARDTTEHVLVEKALRQSEEAFRKLFEENPIGIVLAGLDHKIMRVNNALSAMLGFSEAELAGKDLRELKRNVAPEFDSNIERLLRGEVRSFQSEAIFETKRKHPVWGHATTSAVRDAENAPIAIFQMIENIQDRKSSEEQVLAYQEELQSLASELSLSEERERRRIATNLHDRIGQSLAFARLKLATLTETNQGEAAAIAEIRELIEQAIVDTRSLTFELSPPVLYELGLVPALEWLARKIQAEHNIKTRFHDDGQPKPLDEDLRVVLFQAVRELLVNVVKHARASHAQVTARRDADALRIIIEDDGIGFEVSRESAKHEAARSFGLFNIRERVEYLGGRVKISSEVGQGTRVTLIAPLRVETKETGLGHGTDNNRGRS